MEQYMQDIIKTSEFLKAKIGRIPDVAVVLGSGLGTFADGLEEKIEIPYGEIPGFVVSTVIGHAGKLIIGFLGEKMVLAMQGRFHLYEGHDAHKVSFPVRVFKTMGINNLILTNAAGGVSRALNPGDLMIISDHISFYAPSPLKGINLDELGPRFPDMSEVYSKKLITLAEKAANDLGIGVKKGIYCYAQGPMYETPAEIRLMNNLGIDAVGMSTVTEAIAAKHAGMNILGISCVTNMASGILPQPLNHKEVTETANKVGKNFSNLLSKIITIWED